MGIGRPLALAAILRIGRNAMIGTGTLAMVMHGMQAIAVLAKRHALSRRHGGHALDRQNQRYDEDKSM